MKTFNLPPTLERFIASIGLYVGCHAGIVIALLIISHAALTNAQTVFPVRLKERGALVHPPIMPRHFRGRWSVDVRACDAASVDDSQIEITAKALDYYETNGHIIRIAVQSNQRLVVTLKAQGEGITFTAMKALTLSPDGKALKIRDQDDTKQTEFQRCPLR